MRPKPMLLIASVICAAGLAAGAAGAGDVAAQPGASGGIAMSKWEYSAVPAPAMGRFAGLGAEGWELVSVSDGTAYFKRPLASPAK